MSANKESKVLSKNSKTSKIGVVGLGYVGLPLAVLAKRKGYEVIGVDINSEKVDLIKHGQSPFKDKKTNKELNQHRISATTDFAKLSEVKIIIVCVPTPVLENHLPDLSYVESASIKIGKNLKPGQLVILESTVNPGVCEEIVLPILEKTSGLKSGQGFYFSYAPERVSPGDKTWTVENIPRVLGGLNADSLSKAKNFYESILDAEIKPMDSLKEAEAVKVVENSFRDVNIAFVNELAKSFDKAGIDVIKVIEGAATKPFSFIPHYPACGVGGHCIPVDPYYLIDYARKNGFNHQLLSLARNINDSMPEYTVDKLLKLLKSREIKIAGSRVAVLGLSYKPNVDDTRESPAFKIIDLLKKQKIKPVVYDPHVNGDKTVGSLDEALKNAVAVVITTGHSEFTKLSPEYFLSRNIEVIVDGYNCLPKKEFLNSGITYQGIGR